MAIMLCLPSEPKYMEQLICAMTVLWPSYRGVLKVVDDLCKKKWIEPEKFTCCFNEALGNKVLGWVFGHGWLLWRPTFRASMQEICGFEKREAFFIQCEPMSTVPFLDYYCTVNEATFKNHDARRWLETKRNGPARYLVTYRCIDIADGECLYEEAVDYASLENAEFPWSWR